MKLPRASMTTTLFVILVLAVDFGIARALLTNIADLSLYGLGLMPVATALVFGIYRLARLRSQAGGFTIGFVVVGLASSLAYAATIQNVQVVATWAEQGLDRIEAGLMALLPEHLAESTEAGDIAEVLGLMVVFSLPPSLAALAGGWLAGRFAMGKTASHPPRHSRARTRPRITLRSLLILVAIAAVDLAAIRGLAQSVHFGQSFASIGPSGLWLAYLTPWGLAVVHRWALFAVGLLPMANLLLLGLLGVFRARSRSGSFLVGFEVGGGLATLACLAACAIAPESMLGSFDHFGGAVRWSLDQVFGQRQVDRFVLSASYASLAVAIGLYPVFFTLPPLVAALSGGAISRRFGRTTAG